MNIEIKEHPPYKGAFTKNEHPGAFKNGLMIYKKNSEPGDLNEDGDTGVILGSICHDGIILYFVAWDSHPSVAIGVTESKISSLLGGVII